MDFLEQCSEMNTSYENETCFSSWSSLQGKQNICIANFGSSYVNELNVSFAEGPYKVNIKT